MHRHSNLKMSDIPSNVISGQLAVFFISFTKEPIPSWIPEHTILSLLSRKWLRTSKLKSMRLLMSHLVRSFLSLWFMRKKIELLGDSFGFLVFLLTKSLISEVILTISEMWPSSLIGWPKSSGKVESSLLSLKWKTRFLSILSSNSSTPTLSLLFRSSKKVSSTVIYLILLAMTSMSQAKNNSMTLKNLIFNMKSISKASKSL